MSRAFLKRNFTLNAETDLSAPVSLLSVQDYPKLKLSYYQSGNSIVARIAFNDPKALNAISDPVLQSFNKALSRIENGVDHKARCLVLSGEGRAFCAGANIGGGGGGGRGGEPQDLQVFPDTAGLPGAGSSLVTKYHPLMIRLRDLNMPIVAICQGPIAGVGMSFAMAADMCICSDDAYFLQAFRNIGLVPDGGSTYLLPRKVGMARAMELSLMGERLPAQEALQIGLCNRVVARKDLDDFGMKFAARVATGPTKMMSMTRKLYWSSYNNTYEEQMAQEARFQNVAGASKDAGIGGNAFRNKEKNPKFIGE